MAAGAIYVIGALGVEMLTSYFGGQGLIIELVVIVEETMEMLGVVLFIYAILDHLKNNVGAFINLSINNVADLKIPGSDGVGSRSPVISAPKCPASWLVCGSAEKSLNFCQSKFCPARFDFCLSFADAGTKNPPLAKVERHRTANDAYFSDTDDFRLSSSARKIFSCLLIKSLLRADEGFQVN